MTGALSGLGRLLALALALALARDGYALALHYHASGDAATFIRADLADPTRAPTPELTSRRGRGATGGVRGTGGSGGGSFNDCGT